MEGGVGEDGVELVLVWEGGGVVMSEFNAAGAMEVALACGGEHVGRGVYAEGDGSGFSELFGEGSVSAAEVEDLFPGLGLEEGDDFGGEVGDEAAVCCVGFGVPGLAGLFICAHEFYCALEVRGARGR